jgi:Transcriptional regulator, AbiEi antitoxin, Type IV TA system/Transcriptional regulator, AbiEi antitoxin N-terminal domain
MERSSINKLQNLVPEGVPITTKWLRERGLSNSIQQKYHRSGWLKTIGYGANYRPGQPLTWQTTMAAAQAQGELLHIGGITALHLHGLSHYLPFGHMPVHIHSNKRPPKWLEGLTFDGVTLVWHLEDIFKKQLLATFALTDLRNLDKAPPSVAARLGMTVWRTSNPELQLVISSPERAILEMLATLPNDESWDTTTETFSGLVNLKPRLLAQLLRACRNIKVKRLFMVQAEHHRHAWLKHLELSDVDFGSGKRQVYAGGTLHAKYAVTIPTGPFGINDAKSKF